MIALNLLSLAVVNGDLLSDFTGGFIINFGEFSTEQFGGFLSYLSSMLVSAIVFTGPLHYYVEWNRMSIIIILIITFFFTGFVLGKMFKHPLWALASGFAVMGSFMITLNVIMYTLDYVATSSMELPFNISEMMYSAIKGTFDMDLDVLYTYTILENGSFLGISSMFWAVILSPSKKSNTMNISMFCDDGDFCKV